MAATRIQLAPGPSILWFALQHLPQPVEGVVHLLGLAEDPK